MLSDVSILLPDVSILLSDVSVPVLSADRRCVAGGGWSGDRCLAFARRVSFHRGTRHP